MNRDQLTEALALWDSERDLDGSLIDITPIIEAARLLLDFPTDEMVEAATESAMRPGVTQPAAMLEAVRRVMYGEAE